MQVKTIQNISPANNFEMDQIVNTSLNPECDCDC